MKTTFPLLLVLCSLLSACSVFPGQVLPTPTESPAPTPYDAPIQPPAAITAAQKALAELLAVQPHSFKAISLLSSRWPNGCLGLDTPAMTCTQEIVPGYQVILELDGRRYEVRTNQDASLAIPGDVVADSINEFAPVVQGLARHLNVRADAVQFVRARPIAWDSPCLGYVNPAELCAQSVTPGLNIFLQQAGQLFEVHADVGLTHARLPGGIELLAE